MTTPQPADASDFAALGLPTTLTAVLDDLGYEEPTPIQQAAIPVLLEGRDVLGQAATGTGKTAAFALPMLARLAERPTDDPAGDAPAALVLVPTRELAMQVSQAIHTYGRQLRARVLPVYGGQSIGRQLSALRRGVDVVVATPGRAIDHLGRGSLDLQHVELLVLDEADEMLDMGFAEDLEQLLSQTPSTRQTALFSATLPKRIAGLAARHLQDPERIVVTGDAPTGGDDPRIREVVHVVARHHKPAALARVLDIEAPEATLVFCRTRRDVDELTEVMNGRGYRAEALHGGMSQEQRDRVMGRLRTGVAELLVATDVAARGLDVDTLTHVVNHSVPSAPESYVHRIGRVGRAGREGVAITLVEPREHRALKSIERHTGRRMEVEPLPTVADLHERRLGMLRADLREEILADEHGAVRPTVESLTDEFDPMAIALAAVTLLHAERGGTEDENDVPDASLKAGGKKGGKTSGGGGGGKGRLDPVDAVRVWVSLGRQTNIRPKDLVGAITGETSLTGRQIGSIQIAKRQSFVEVPREALDEVVDALNRTRIRGQKAHAARAR